LLTRLKAWRKQRSSADGVPAYVVFHDATLEAIAEAVPASERDLLAIKGIGPAKAERYGDELLDLIEAAQP
jgi:superfamily II DNA helicase RecQ